MDWIGKLHHSMECILSGQNVDDPCPCVIEELSYSPTLVCPHHKIQGVKETPRKDKTRNKSQSCHKYQDGKHMATDALSFKVVVDI